MIITPNKFALIIENTVKNKKMSYMDAIIEYCNNNGMFTDSVSNSVSSNLKSLLTACCNSSNVIWILYHLFG